MTQSSLIPVRRKRRVRRAGGSAARVARSRDERGDIAGWVMITVMTIMLAGAITQMFTPRVTQYLESALDQFM